MISFRQQLKLANLGAETVGKFRRVWKKTRTNTTLMSKNYFLLVDIAEKLKIKIPKPKINMEAKEDAK